MQENKSFIKQLKAKGINPNERLVLQMILQEKKTI
jgi:hypothetical protein